MRRRGIGIVSGLVVVLAATTARASGFLLYEQTARAQAMGSAVSASVRDPSAVWFDPAALTFAEPAGASMTTALVVPGTRFSPAGGGPEVDSQTGPRVVPNLFAHARLSDSLHAGLGIYAPFGLVVDWPVGWVGAEQSLATDLRVVAINPTLAVRIVPRLSLAAGVSVLRGSVALATALPQPPGGRADLAGNAWGAAANVAVLWRQRPDELHFAFTYRTRSKLAFTGHADFVTETPGYEATFMHQNASASLTVPDLLTFGAMWRPHPRLELDADVNWTLWSAFKELAISFDQPALNRRIERSVVDPFTVRAGAEWRWFPRVCLRAGASFDQSASRKDTLAPSAPDAQRLELGTGAGFTLGRVTVDVAYLYAHFLPAESAGPRAKPEGTYRTQGHVLGVTLGVR